MFSFFAYTNTIGHNIFCLCFFSSVGFSFYAFLHSRGGGGVWLNVNVRVQLIKRFHKVQKQNEKKRYFEVLESKHKCHSSECLKEQKKSESERNNRIGVTIKRTSELQPDAVSNVPISTVSFTFSQFGLCPNIARSQATSVCNDDCVLQPKVRAKRKRKTKSHF